MASPQRLGQAKSAPKRPGMRGCDGAAVRPSRISCSSTSVTDGLSAGSSRNQETKKSTQTTPKKPDAKNASRQGAIAWKAGPEKAFMSQPMMKGAKAAPQRAVSQSSPP